MDEEYKKVIFDLLEVETSEEEQANDSAFEEQGDKNEEIDY
jgi:hypothetical protein